LGFNVGQIVQLPGSRVLAISAKVRPLRLPADVVERVKEAPCGLTLAVPSLPTTTPAAVLAKHGSVGERRPSCDRKRQNAENGVPGPVTSKTCRPVAPRSIPGWPTPRRSLQNSSPERADGGAKIPQIRSSLFHRA